MVAAGSGTEYVNIPVVPALGGHSLEPQDVEDSMGQIEPGSEYEGKADSLLRVQER